MIRLGWKKRATTMGEGEVAAIQAWLGRRSIVMVGLMGCGKSSVGRRLAAALDLDFVDADDEIETAAGMTIPEIFAAHGEAYFRNGERRVIARILDNGPQVLATGGGAYMNEATQAKIRDCGFSIWLRAELPVLMRRVMKRDNRPLIKTADPEATMRDLMTARYPVYARADLTVDSREVPHEVIVNEIFLELARRAASTGQSAGGPGAGPQAPGPAPQLPFHNKEPAAMTARQEPVSVPVNLGQRSYEVLVGAGLLADTAARIGRHLKVRKCAIVTDENVAKRHLAAVEGSLRAAGLHAGTLVLPPGETTKSLEQLGHVADGLIGMGLERGDLVVALGGGVIGDLVGFAASVVRRGIRFVQIPTSLLAQVDSSVGGKTAINSRHGKNLIGAFHQPSLVIADTDALATLPAREMRAGYAEVVKYGLLGDAGFFDWLDGNWRRLFGNDPSVLAEAVERSVRAKAAIVERDETETGDRMLLNLGHTFGHALEAWAGFGDRLLHGEAVAIGMAQAFRFSELQRLCRAGTAARVEAHLKSVGLPTRVGDIPGPERPSVDALVGLMAQDKKVRDGRMTFILVRDIGRAFVTRDVEMAPLQAFLADEVRR